jgi:putative membrane protein (TIGR04086 family)
LGLDFARWLSRGARSFLDRHPAGLLAGQESLLYSAPPASFAATFVFGMLVARKALQRRVLQGTLVGVVAMLIYVGMTFGRPEPPAYLVAHVLKVFGGAAGGFVARRRGAANAVARPA